ncbi:hypothetical protein ACU639_29405 [Streptomyces cynarae]|uniref:hypothetical protein n=1 Tax=Streptomyces cynarae TaxID=2981134 RepID=UPI00406C1BE1
MPYGYRCSKGPEQALRPGCGRQGAGVAARAAVRSPAVSRRSKARAAAGPDTRRATAGGRGPIRPLVKARAAAGPDTRRATAGGRGPIRPLVKARAAAGPDTRREPQADGT